MTHLAAFHLWEVLDLCRALWCRLQHVLAAPTEVLEWAIAATRKRQGDLHLCRRLQRNLNTYRILIS